MFDHSPIKDGFPRYAGELLRQASFFTGLTFRLTTEDTLEEKKNRDPNSSFLIYQESKPRWDRFLYATNAAQNANVYRITHDIADTMYTYYYRNEEEIGEHKTKFILEQINQVTSHMICATLNLARFPYPETIAYPLTETSEGASPAKITADPLPCLSPSPLSAFYRTPKGATHAREKFLTYDGTIRFDLIAADCLLHMSHYYAHYKTMGLFSQAAERLAQDDDFFNRAMDCLHDRQPDQPPSFAALPRIERAGAYLATWWQAIQKNRKAAYRSSPDNYYTGQHVWMDTQEDALDHPAKIRRILCEEAKNRPSDPLAVFMKGRITAQGKQSRKKISVESALRRYYDSYPDFCYEVPDTEDEADLQSVETDVKNGGAVRDPARGNHVNARGGDGLNP